MSELITPEIFDHLVDLAALELDAAQAEYLRRELNNQLKAIHELEAIPLEENLTITSHGVPYTAASSPALRADEWIAYPDPAAILAQTPQVAGGYIIVPDIPHTTLE
jgi:aspartyl-tRNA(Asn)/glutamyl-tRNA(Gln) amidotransferase subunit C